MSELFEINPQKFLIYLYIFSPFIYLIPPSVPAYYWGPTEDVYLAGGSSDHQLVAVLAQTDFLDPESGIVAVRVKAAHLHNQKGGITLIRRAWEQ